MSELIVPTRRGFLLGMGALIVAPAVVKVTSLMPIRGEPLVGLELTRENYQLLADEALASHTADAMHYSMVNRMDNRLLSIDAIMKEAVRLFKSENSFIKHIYSEQQADLKFVNGTVWRFR